MAFSPLALGRCISALYFLSSSGKDFPGAHVKILTVKPPEASEVSLKEVPSVEDGASFTVYRGMNFYRFGI